ncbi:MAG TPA: tetratricopeptide repeat protein [Steroidobacteraceae bacterium]|nr:tetratricopeptide repeat protein [Steroidobacteraceae bacterium]
MNRPPMQGETGFWARLRRRKVVQWALAYCAAAWAVLQGIGFVADAFGWPPATKQLATLALPIGLLVTLVLAWYHGDRGEQRFRTTEMAIIGLLLTVGGILLWQFQRANPSQGSASTTAAASRSVAAADIADRPSIAVLPFENRSDVESDEFFVDGMHDDILTQLTKVSGLRVISRTSVEQFRDSALPTRSIAERLGVSRILEGGVQRAGSRVRITVQLIDTATDAHLWAENYDRELTAENIFSIQSEIAVAVAAALETAVTPAERARVRALPTRDLAAWEAYHAGRTSLGRRTAASLAEAAEHFKRAIERDPGLALAYVGLADATWLQADYGGRPLAPAVAEAEQLLQRALGLDPELAEARVTLAKLAQDRREFDRAEALYRRAIELNPSYATAHHWYSQLLSFEGRDAEAHRSLQRAVELDPLSVLLQSALAWSLSGFGRFEESLAGFRKASEIDPSSPLPYEGMAAVHAWAFGRLDEALLLLEQAHRLDASVERTARMAQIHLELGDESTAAELLASVPHAGRTAATVSAYLHLYRGEHGAAVEQARVALQADPRNTAALALLRDAALAAGDVEAARASYARAFPELLAQDAPDLNFENFNAAIDLALVLQRGGERARAGVLLDKSEAQLRSLVRTGPWGYGLADVRIHLLRGQTAEALRALQEAQRASWRGPYWRYCRDHDPALAAIRSRPEFAAVFDAVEREVAGQRNRLARRSR